MAKLNDGILLKEQRKSAHVKTPKGDRNSERACYVCCTTDIGDCFSILSGHKGCGRNADIPRSSLERCALPASVEEANELDLNEP